jgi:hypothetical protein
VPNWRRVVSKGEGCGDGDDRITCVTFLYRYREDFVPCRYLWRLCCVMGVGHSSWLLEEPQQKGAIAEFREVFHKSIVHQLL